jgi:hypothetical protein
MALGPIDDGTQQPRRVGGGVVEEARQARRLSLAGVRHQQVGLGVGTVAGEVGVELLLVLPEWIEDEVALGARAGRGHPDERRGVERRGVAGSEGADRHDGNTTSLGAPL